MKPIEIASFLVGIAGVLFGLWAWLTDTVPGSVEEMRGELVRLTEAIAGTEGLTEENREEVLKLLADSQGLSQAIERSAVENGVRNIPVTRLAEAPREIKVRDSEVLGPARRHAAGGRVSRVQFRQERGRLGRRQHHGRRNCRRQVADPRRGNLRRVYAGHLMGSATHHCRGLLQPALSRRRRRFTQI